MSSNAFAATLDIRPRPSRTLLRLLVAAHTVAAVSLLIWIPQWWALWPSIAILLGSLVINYRRHWKFTGSGVLRRVIWQTGGEWRIAEQGVEPQRAVLRPGCFVSPFLVVLVFDVKTTRKRRTLLLLRDSLDADTFRRIRARLKVTALAPSVA